MVVGLGSVLALFVQDSLPPFSFLKVLLSQPSNCFMYLSSCEFDCVFRSYCYQFLLLFVYLAFSSCSCNRCCDSQNMNMFVI